MLKRQRNKLYMFVAVRDVCSAHEESWSSVPAFVEVFATFSEKVTLVRDLGRSQSTIIKGVRHQREVLLEEAADIAVQCANALHSYGIRTGNVQLADATDVSKTDILNSTLNGSLETIGFIFNQLEEYAETLEDYGITAEKVQLLNDKLGVLTSQMNTPRRAIISRKTITGQINRLIGEIDDLLDDHLDGLVNILRSESPLFYEEYTNARVIVRSGSRHKNSGDTNDDGLGIEPRGS